MVVSETLTILIADGHPVSVAGLKVWLTGTGRYILQNVHSKSSLMDQLLAKPSLVIIDYQSVKDFDSRQLIHLLQNHTASQFIVFTADQENGSIMNILESGVSGFLFKDCSEDEIIRGVEAVMRGERFFCSQVFDLLLKKQKVGADPDLLKAQLSAREIEIIKLVVSGLSTTAIAERLNLSSHTISTHRKNIFKKLKIKSPVQLVTYAYDLGLFNEESRLY